MPTRSDASGLLHGTLDALDPEDADAGRPPRLRHRALDRGGDRARRCSIEEGSLYPRSTGMERRGWIEAEWGMSELGRKAKFYRITPKGRRQLAAETEQWARFSAGGLEGPAPAGA